MASSSEEASSSREQPHHEHTVVDRTVISLVPFPDDTPSSRDNVDPTSERLHRLQGTFLLFDATRLLKQGPCTFATACSIFHRFYHRISLLQKDVWSVAMACTLLAGKVQEEPRKLRHVIVIYNHLYRKRRLCVHASSAITPLARSKLELPDDEKKLNILRFTPPMPPHAGTIYQEWKQVLCETEHAILQQLGFTLYWIPDSHPHQFILYMVRVLVPESNQDFAQLAWNYCNTACLLDLSTRFEPELIACAAICLTAVDLNVTLPVMSDFAWWQVFVGNEKETSISTVCNAILGLSTELENSGKSSNPEQNDVLLAATTFVPSLVPGGSFNDPESFIWSQAD